MKSSKPVALALSLWLIVALAGVVSGQEQALKARYQAALERAQAKDFDRAYDMAFKVVRENESYYEAQVLLIALAKVLKKTGGETPQNLIRIAKDYAPLGSNLERDVQNMANLLEGTPDGGPGGGGIVPPIVVSPYVRNKIALVVGIGSFEDPKINSLRFAANDARAFADTLTKECRFDAVRLLIDAEATRLNILTEVEQMAKTAQPDDLVVIYIASHGSPENMDSAGVNYIVTHDSMIDNLYATSYKMKDLLNDIETRIKAQRVVAFIDTCFSGATFKQKPREWTVDSRVLQQEASGLRLDAIKDRLRNGEKGVKIGPVSPKDQRRKQAIGRVIIASSRQNQTAWESDSIEHGYFTYYLLKALTRQGAVSVQELYDYLSAEVPMAVQRGKNAAQNPTMVSSLDGPVQIYIKEKD